MLNFFDFFELDFSDFLSVKILFILHFIFCSSFLSVEFLFILHFIFFSSFSSVKFLFSSFLSVNLNFFIFNI